MAKANETSPATTPCEAPWTYEAWLTPETWAAARADSQWAAERHAAKLRDKLHRYPLLHAELKIRLAIDILWDVFETWDHDSLEHYPKGMRSFDEYIAHISSPLYEIRWHRPGVGARRDLL